MDPYKRMRVCQDILADVPDADLERLCVKRYCCDQILYQRDPEPLKGEQYAREECRRVICRAIEGLALFRETRDVLSIERLHQYPQCEEGDIVFRMQTWILCDKANELRG